MRTGTTIGHYVIGDLLGQGGMGEVYRAVDTRLDRPVAIKFLARRYVADEGAKARFIREARSASALDHPNICTIHDIGETDEGELYLVMALYGGATLQARLKEEHFEIGRAVHVVRQVAQALKRAHEAGIVHRDVKPANVMLGDDDAVRLLDFGVAKLQSNEALTETGVTLGTAAYMSPEQALGEPVTPASDVWSLGVVAYEMLAGRLPFEAERPLAILNLIVQAEPDPLTSVRPDVPTGLAEVVHRAMARDATDRPADGAAFVEVLDAVVGSSGVERARVPAGGARRTAPAAGRRRGWLPVGLTVAVAALVAVAVWAAGVTAPVDADTVVLAEDARNVVAVMPFSVTGSPDLAYLEEGLMDLVGGRLDGAGPLRTVDPRAIVGLGESRTSGLDAPRGAALAREVGAGRFVLGRVVALPGEVSLSARLHDAFGEGPEPVLVTVEGPVDDLSALVDELATGLLEASLSGANARIQLSAAQSAGSLEATKEFLRGEQFHRRGQFDSASAAYNRALARDSTFALAHLMKSMNNAYTYETDDYAAAAAAMRFSGGLAERDRSLIEAFLDLQTGRLTQAEQGFQAHLKRWPDEVKALLMLGHLYQRSNVRWARPIQASRPYFQRSLELEPDNVPALHNLARLDAAAGFTDSLPLRTRVLDRVAPGSEWAVDAGTLSAFVRGDRPAIDRLVETFREQSLLVRLYASYNAMRFSADPDDVDRLLAVQRSGPVNTATGIPESYDLGEDMTEWGEQLAHLVRGRHDRSREFLAGPLSSEAWKIWKAELVVADLFDVDPAETERLLGEVRAIDPEARLRNPVETLHDIFTPAVAELERDVNVAKLLGRLGRFDEAWAIQRRIEALPPIEAFESLREDAAGGVAADLLVLQGDSARALGILRSLPYQLPLTARTLSLTHGSHARFLRAELERSIGDAEVARELYEGFVGGFAPADKIFLAQSYLRLGELHESAGRLDEAARYYRRWLANWSEPSPGLVPQRDEVRRRLEALQARAAA